MARGRFVSKSIAVNPELEAVSFEADFLFGRCVPHLDADGRMGGHPAFVKGTSCPLRPEMTVEVVERCLGELAGAIDGVGEPLVRWYRVGGKPYLEFPGFGRQQTGLRKDREGTSRIPPADDPRATPVVEPPPGALRPTPGERPESSGPAPPKRSEGKVEAKGREGTSFPLPSVEKKTAQGASKSDPKGEKKAFNGARWAPLLDELRVSKERSMSVLKVLEKKWDDQTLEDAIRGIALARDRGWLKESLGWGPTDEINLVPLNRQVAGMPTVREYAALYHREAERSPKARGGMSSLAEILS